VVLERELRFFYAYITQLETLSSRDRAEHEEPTPKVIASRSA